MEKYIYNINNLDAWLNEKINYKAIWQGWIDERTFKTIHLICIILMY